MTEFNFYYSLSEEAKEVIRSIAPRGWKPPPDKWDRVDIEGTEEVGHLIRQKPRDVKRNGRW